MFHTINNDNIFDILTKLDPIDILKCSLLSRHFYELCNLDTLWNKLLMQYDNRKQCYDFIEYENKKELFFVFYYLEPFFEAYIQTKYDEDKTMFKERFEELIIKCYDGNIFKLNDRTSVDCYKAINGYDAIPKEFFKNIKNINICKEIKFYNTELISVPDNLCTLKHLVSIYFNNNKITAIRDNIFDINSLTYINFSRNNINALDPSISKLTNLTFLDLSQNFVDHIPSELALLTNLKFLDLGYNKLSYFPDEICQLTNLKVLGFSMNDDESGDHHSPYLPSDLINLVKLRILLVNDYRFGINIPDELLNKKRLFIDNEITFRFTDYMDYLHGQISRKELLVNKNIMHNYQWHVDNIIHFDIENNDDSFIISAITDENNHFRNTIVYDTMSYDNETSYNILKKIFDMYNENPDIDIVQYVQHTDHMNVRIKINNNGNNIIKKFELHEL